MATTTTGSETWLTQEAYDRLSAELEQLTGPGRTEVVRRIEAAREEGDLKENGGYHAAREEQGKMEGRIRQLEQLLRHAKIGAPPVEEGVAGPGTVLTVLFEGDDEPERFLLGSREDDPEGLQAYSTTSPLGTALLGAREGETVSYEVAESGATMTLTLQAVEPYRG